MDMTELRDHPVFTRDFTVMTFAMADACEIAVDAIFMRQTGIVFYGLSRVGKTYCLNEIKNKLVGFMPRTYVTHIEVKKKDGTYTNNIIWQLGKEENCYFKSRDIVIVKLDSFVERILLRCHERGCNHWVLLLDEFQKLRYFDLHLLADIFNMLQRKKITMTVLSFGMPGIFELRDDIQHRDDGELLIGRFMTNFIEFPGCRDKASLKLILDAFDRSSEFPESSGISYTQGLMPRAFSSGFSLVKYIQPIWSALNREALGAYHNNLPLEHVFLTLRYLLRFGAMNDVPDFELSQEAIEHAVKLSCIKTFSLLAGKKKNHE
jgi:hypothetical protein